MEKRLESLEKIQFSNEELTIIAECVANSNIKVGNSKPVVVLLEKIVEMIKK